MSLGRRESHFGEIAGLAPETMPGAEVDMAQPFASMAALKNQRLLVPESNTHFPIERNFLVSMMADRLAAIKFDEAWYLAKYPDVKEAVRRGTVASARDNYVTNGLYEHLMPVAMQ